VLDALLRRLAGKGRPAEADDAFDAESIYAEARRLQGAGDHAAALGRYEALLARFPDEVALNVNAGALLVDMHRPQDALAYLDRAARIAPEERAVDEHRARAWALLGRYAEAAAAERRLLRDDPDDAGRHFRLAHVLLGRGELAEGWAEYEWRLRGPGFNWGVRDLPRWGGGDAAGRRLLVICEQGLGDAMMFARFVPPLVARGAHVTLLCRRPLAPLFESSFGPLGVTVTSEATGPTGDLDAHVHLLSLPHRLGVERVADLAVGAPYLAVARDLAARWHAEVARHPGLRVGLMWAGNPDNPADRLRSVPRETAAAFAAADRGIAWFNLLVDNERERPVAPPFPMIDLPQRDFADSAALIDALDLVVSVDTSVAHAAGALGKPLWLLAQFEPGWRWQMGDVASPWYRDVRMFRPRAPAAWDAVIGDVRDALAAEVRGRG
jgi:hypothetical protein